MAKRLKFRSTKTINCQWSQNTKILRFTFNFFFTNLNTYFNAGNTDPRIWTDKKISSRLSMCQTNEAFKKTRKNWYTPRNRSSRAAFSSIFLTMTFLPPSPSQNSPFDRNNIYTNPSMFHLSKPLLTTSFRRERKVKGYY